MLHLMLTIRSVKTITCLIIQYTLNLFQILLSSAMQLDPSCWKVTQLHLVAVFVHIAISNWTSLLNWLTTVDGVWRL